MHDIITGRSSLSANDVIEHQLISTKITNEYWLEIAHDCGSEDRFYSVANRGTNGKSLWVNFHAN